MCVECYHAPGKLHRPEVRQLESRLEVGRKRSDKRGSIDKHRRDGELEERKGKLGRYSFELGWFDW
jgi:hypothetical protein